jgi:hypothetical protein
MKFQKLSYSSTFSCLLFAAAGAATTTLSACPSFGSFFRQADSALPIEVHHSGSGQIMSFRAHETSDRLFIAGTAQRHPLIEWAHVDIQLIGPAGNVIAEKRDDINPLRPRHGGGKRYSDTYVASFPLNEARQAATIRVIYRNGAHSKCRRTQG